MAEAHRTPPRPLTDAERRQVIEEAFKAQGRAEEAAESAEKLTDLARAAEELGLDPAHLAEAEAIVRMRAEEAERRATTPRSRLPIFVIAGAALALLVAVPAVLLLFGGMFTLGAVRSRAADGPSEQAPAVERIPASSFSLDHNAATEASSTTRDGGVALTVTRFGAEANEQYWANLESTAPLSWDGAQTVALVVSGEGTLENGRVYLESGDERWRSPAFGVTPVATPVELDVADFEHQLRRDGAWKVVDHSPPVGAPRVSVKFGWWVNDIDRSGTVVVRDVEVRR